MSVSSLSIGRGWSVVTADGKRVGDVTEVHDHYLLISHGIIRVRDFYLPLGSVERAEGNTVVLSVTNDALRKMNLSHPPPPPEPAQPLHDPQPDYDSSSYSETTGGDPITFPGSWEGDDTPSFDEMPSYNKPQPNGLVEAEVGLNLAFSDLGYGQTIVLVPGWPFDSTIWEPLPSVLAEDYRVVTFDPRGTGGSDRPWDFYSLEMIAHDLHRLAVEQALRDITLVAWSGAAASALLYARDHRDRVTRVVLLGPLFPLWLAEEDAADRYVVEPTLNAETQQAWATELLDDRPAFFERLVDHLTHRPLSGPRRSWLSQRLMHGAPHAQMKIWEALRTFDPEDLLPEVQPPVTIISGEHDRLSPPALGARLAEALPRAQSVTISDCGHALFLDQREALATALRDLIGTYQYTPDEPVEDAQGEDLLGEDVPAAEEGNAAPADAPVDSSLSGASGKASAVPEGDQP